MVDGPFGVEITKSFVNGKWQPITSIPKPSLNVAVERGTFGQKHLKAVSAARRKGYKQIRYADKKMGQVLGKIKGNNFDHPLADNTFLANKKGKDFKKIGPAVMWHRKGNVAVNLSDKRLNNFLNTSDEWKKDRMHAAQKFGSNISRSSSTPEAVRAHEAAHASRDSGKGGGKFIRTQTRAVNRGVDNIDYADNNSFLKPSELSFMNTPKKRIWDEAESGIMRESGRLSTREEARADVLASRHLKRPILSGHWREKGYLEDRNMIARGMKQPELKKLGIMRKPSPTVENLRAKSSRLRSQ